MTVRKRKKKRTSSRRPGHGGQYPLRVWERLHRLPVQRVRGASGLHRCHASPTETDSVSFYLTTDDGPPTRIGGSTMSPDGPLQRGPDSPPDDEGDWMSGMLRHMGKRRTDRDIRPPGGRRRRKFVPYYTVNGTRFLYRCPWLKTGARVLGARKRSIWLPEIHRRIHRH